MRWVCGVAGEKQTSVGLNGRSRCWEARALGRVTLAGIRDTDLASVALGTAASASDNVTPYLRDGKWDVPAVVCIGYC